MLLLPAVSDGKAVLESNYSIVGFSKNVCLALFFKVAVVDTIGQIDTR